ncbi:hypothetical protein Tco_1307063 [Tanacetum coccineum]
MHNDEELRLNLDLLEERRKRAAIREAKAKSKMIKYYDARVDASHAVDEGKLGPKLSILIIGLPRKRVATPVATDSASLLYVYLRR